MNIKQKCNTPQKRAKIYHKAAEMLMEKHEKIPNCRIGICETLRNVLMPKRLVIQFINCQSDTNILPKFDLCKPDCAMEDKLAFWFQDARNPCSSSIYKEQQEQRIMLLLFMEQMCL